mmetsp:Transcript_18535/g.52263  ORF Transcript_18535/g.52263 Transcript_18535/m.52263 type:complete len:359 (+) Transcript_18535:168-1244(+)|eukprot:CAMPEP_0119142476 /NCGR_PEP_ID=MMETSP1310-20130426/32708_1 /TAXON_ID=464262 /ORGANISM="Genus nov. species nov., Strain RCC2339" /LENGTH=358 /DNA_ID=CAMNT_0007134017 /DNA_START=160 /DNA_END=1236 /DNA_ORIENTATION=+
MNRYGPDPNSEGSGSYSRESPKEPPVLAATPDEAPEHCKESFEEWGTSVYKPPIRKNQNIKTKLFTTVAADKALKKIINQAEAEQFVETVVLPPTIISPLFAIPKKEKGNWKIILDLHYLNKYQKTPKFRNEDRLKKPRNDSGEKNNYNYYDNSRYQVGVLPRRNYEKPSTSFGLPVSGEVLPLASVTDGVVQLPLRICEDALASSRTPPEIGNQTANTRRRYIDGSNVESNSNQTHKNSSRDIATNRISHQLGEIRTSPGTRGAVFGNDHILAGGAYAKGPSEEATECQSRRQTFTPCGVATELAGGNHSRKIPGHTHDHGRIPDCLGSEPESERENSQSGARMERILKWAPQLTMI